ncbi:MAG: alpha/beta hydrolase [Bryobacteraceae bacterium]
MPEIATIDIGGMTIRYRQAGHGDPVLLLHGWGGSLESMDPIFNAITPYFRATSIDFPGHGQSSLPPEPWHVSDFLDLTMRFMDRMELQRPHIVSHSFGGRVTIKLAAQHPERAGKLLFTAGAGVKPPLSAKQKLKRAAAKLKFLAPAGLRERAAPYLASSDYANAGALRPTLRHVVDEDLTPLLASVQSPCLLIWGDQDHETPPYCGETMHRLLPHNEYIVFPGAGHFPYLDQLHKFNLLALKFLRDEAA